MALPVKFERKVPDTMGDYAFFMGEPDGPMKFIESLGIEVPTYIDPRVDLRPAKGPKAPTLMYHVPWEFRGPYSPEELANYDPEREYELNKNGATRCTAINSGAGGDPTSRSIPGSHCARAAINRSPFCTSHGGALHPADKLFTRERGIVPSDTRRLNRIQKVELKLIAVEDLTDEEIIRGAVQMEDGHYMEVSKKAQKWFANAVKSEMMRRVDKHLNAKVFDMLGVMEDMAKSDLNEARDRIDSAKWWIERVIGKTPDVLITNKTDKPFESMMTDVTSGSREAYRESVRGAAIEEDNPNIVEGVVVSEAFDETEGPENSGEQIVSLDDEGDAGEESDSDNEPDSAPGGVPSVEISPPNGDGATVEANDAISQRIEDAKELAKQRKEAKERIQKARKRRFAAKAQGRTDLNDLAYEIEFKNETDYQGRPQTRLRFIAPDAVKLPRGR